VARFLAVSYGAGAVTEQMIDEVLEALARQAAGGV
jgi:hypothetical protein